MMTTILALGFLFRGKNEDKLWPINVLIQTHKFHRKKIQFRVKITQRARKLKKVQAKNS